MPELTAPPAARASVFAAALWSVASRWTSRGVGLLSTLALVRLLSPDDFGVMAMAMLVIGLVEVVMDLGSATWLMQRKDATPHDFDLVWSVRALQLLAIGVTIALAAPLAGRYFGDPRITWVMLALAANAAISGLESTGPIAWERSLDFRSPFQLALARRLLGAAATLAAAVVLGNYWALVIGMTASSIAGVVLSYRMCRFRPRWTLAGAGPLFSASKWLMLQSLSGYLNGRIDAFLLGRAGGTRAVGLYTMAHEISALPTVELLSPMSRVLLPGLVQVRDQPDALRQRFLLATGIQAAAAIPMTVGMAMTAHLIVPVVLGPDWIESIGVLRLLAVVAGIATLTYSSSYLQLAAGRFRFMAALSALSTLGIVVLGTMLFDFSHPVEIARARCLVAVLSSLTLLVSVLAMHPVVTPRALLATYVRPALAATAMAAVLASCLDSRTLLDHPVSGLVVLVSAGALAYASTLAALWLLAGRPEGPEAYLLGKLRGGLYR